MKKKTFIILLIILSLVGSLTVFYATNLFMSDVCNFAVMSETIFATFPMFMIGLDFVLIIMFIVRLYKHPEYKKELIKSYSLVLQIFSSIGLITAILTGTVSYGDFLAPYPFEGYTIITLVINLLLLVFAILVRFVFVKKIEDDKEKKKIDFKYVIYSIASSLLIYYALNKFGAVILSPVFTQARTVYMTWIEYASLAMPMAFLVFSVLEILNVYKNSKGRLAVSIIYLIVVVALQTAVIIIGKSDPVFVSAVSPAEPLERLATMPMDAIFRTVLVVGLGFYYLVYSYKMVVRSEK